MESMYQMKLNHLTKQLDNTMVKQKDTEKYLKHYRKKEAAEKEECVKVMFDQYLNLHLYFNLHIILA